MLWHLRTGSNVHCWRLGRGLRLRSGYGGSIDNRLMVMRNTMQHNMSQVLTRHALGGCDDGRSPPRTHSETRCNTPQPTVTIQPSTSTMKLANALASCTADGHHPALRSTDTTPSPFDRENAIPGTKPPHPVPTPTTPRNRHSRNHSRVLSVVRRRHPRHPTPLPPPIPARPDLWNWLVARMSLRLVGVWVA